MERIYEIILEFGSEQTSYVSKTGSSDLGSELSKAKSTNPSLMVIKQMIMLL